MAATDCKDHKDRQEGKTIGSPEGWVPESVQDFFALRSVRSMAAELLLFGSQASHSVQNLTLFLRFPKEFCAPSGNEILSFSHGPAPLLDGTRCSGMSAIP